MNKYSRVFVTVLALAPAAEAQESLPCDRELLLNSLGQANRAPEDVNRSHADVPDPVRVLLYRPSLVMDGYKYSAVISKTLKQAWVERTGGYGGEVRWYGPILIDPERFNGCARGSSSALR